MQVLADRIRSVSRTFEKKSCQLRFAAGRNQFWKRLSRQWKRTDHIRHQPQYHRDGIRPTQGERTAYLVTMGVLVKLPDGTIITTLNKHIFDRVNRPD